MLLNLSGTIVPWILGTLIILVLITTLNAAKAWRDMKRSPYFFLRLQAEKRLQNYSISCFGFVLIGLFVSTYAWQNPQDTTVRSALLTNDKPPQAEVSEAVAAVEEAVEAEELEAAQAEEAAAANASLRFLNPIDSSSNASAAANPALPSEFDQFEPIADLSISTNLSSLAFSTEVTDDLEAIEPRRIFPEGYFTIYATFGYEEMADGMEWAWVWRHNGEVVSGGNELWAYGDDGPGYVYLSPEEGFQPGEYAVEVWVNSELLTSSTLVVNNAAVSAGN